MKRSSLIGSLASISLFMGCPGPSSSGDGGVCDLNNLQAKAQLCPDRYTLGFGQEFGSATWVGTSVINTLTIHNGGLEDLTIDSVTLTGAKQFALTTSFFAADGGTIDTLPVSVPGKQPFFVQVTFTPDKPIAYTGVITVSSNAENQPWPDAGCPGSEWCFPISGCGATDAGLPDGGSSYCQRPVP